MHKSSFFDISLSMRKVKWLWSIAIAVGIVLIYAYLSAYFVDTQGVYATFVLPSIALPPIGISIAWSIIYVIDIIVLARLIYYREGLYLAIPIIITGILNVIWCIVFFQLGGLKLSFILSILMAIITLVVGILLIKEDGVSLIIWQIKIAWYIYVCVLGYNLILLN